MENVISRISVDVATDNNFAFIKAVQGDNSTRYAYITLLDNSQPYSLSGSETVVLRGTKPDTHTIFNYCRITDSKEIEVELTTQLLAVAGEGNYEISLYGDEGSGEVLTSFPFIIYVYGSTDVEPIVSSDEFTALTNLMNNKSELAEAINKAENARDIAVEASEYSQSQAELSSDYAKISTSKAVLSTEKAAKAEASADKAKQSEVSSANSAESSSNFADISKSYAIGNTGKRTDENIDNAKYYKEEAERMVANVTNAWIPKGTITFSELPSSPTAGWIYNISDSFVSTDNFADGGGISYPAGTNVYCSEDGIWNCQVVTLTTNNSEIDTIKGLIGNSNISNVGLNITDAISNLSKNLSTENDSIVANKIQILKKNGVSDENAIKIEDASAVDNAVLVTIDWEGNASFEGDVVSTDVNGVKHNLNNKQEKLIAGDNISFSNSKTGELIINASGNTNICLEKTNPSGTGSLSLNRDKISTIGLNSVAVGYNCQATGAYSFAEGYYSNAHGDYSHAECMSTSSNKYSHSEGSDTVSSGEGSHSEGRRTTASGEYSHSEGYYTEATGNNAHSEGYYTTASGVNSHTENNGTKATGNNAHSEGYYTTASGESSHSEGKYTLASSSSCHAEGENTKATNHSSHAEGYYTVANGCRSHTEGLWTIATSDESHVIGRYNAEDVNSEFAEIVGNGYSYYDKDKRETITVRQNARTLDWNGNAWFSGDVIGRDNDKHEHILSRKQNKLTPGKNITIREDSSTGEIVIDAVIPDYDANGGSGGANGNYLAKENPVGTGSFAMNITEQTVIGDYSTSLGFYNSAGYCSFAQGAQCNAEGEYSSAQGRESKAYSNYSFVQGYKNYTNGDYSFAQGKGCEANGEYSFAQGNGCEANGIYSTAFGIACYASGDYSFAKGAYTKSNGNYSVAIGQNSEALADNSVVIGQELKSECEGQFVIGRYNEFQGLSDYVMLVGNGTTSNRKNIYTLDWSGNARYEGAISAKEFKLIDESGNSVSISKFVSVTELPDEPDPNTWYFIQE